MVVCNLNTTPIVGFRNHYGDVRQGYIWLFVTSFYYSYHKYNERENSKIQASRCTATATARRVLLFFVNHWNTSN